MSQLAHSFDGFLDREWPYRSIPKPETYWRLSERWAWSQGKKPDDAREQEALAWARQNYERRYGKPPLETKLDPREPPKAPRPKKRTPPKDTVTPPARDRKPALVF